MIKWNEVKVGETVILNPQGCKYVVIGRRNNAVWLEDMEGFHYTLEVFDASNWTIYDPWEEITEECEFDDHMHVLHNGRYIGHELVDGGWYKRGPGLRVWKRKEGVG